jgi:hypothetical protein
MKLASLSLTTLLMLSIVSCTMNTFPQQTFVTFDNQTPYMPPPYPNYIFCDSYSQYYYTYPQNCLQRQAWIARQRTSYDAAGNYWRAGYYNNYGYGSYGRR